jgi:serine/threonine-protein kinase HipA
MKELIALLDGREAGTVVCRQNGKLMFKYSDSWRTAPGAYPLSLSMPLAAPEHSHAAIDAFLWGLLPDNETVLQSWGRRFHVSPRNAFSLISHVGKDCAGAVQFIAPDEYPDSGEAKQGIEWLTDSEVSARLHALKSDISAGRWSKDQGQFSLAGAQPKTALLFDGNRWGVPYGRIPTTHIIKPAFHLDGHAHNEHVCIALARSIGLPAIKTEIRDFDGITAIIVERYDRVDTAGLAASTAARAAVKASEAALHAASDNPNAAALSAEAAATSMQLAADTEVMVNFSKKTPYYRVHQEDFCQSLGIHPMRKYQNQGGPGPSRIIEMLRAHSTPPARTKSATNRNPQEEDIAAFIGALIFNWIIAGTDAHAKNYSVLIGGKGTVRLAPFYDIASVFGYDDIDPKKAKLAMKIGNKYDLDEIGQAQWKKFAANEKIDPSAVIDEIRTMCLEIPDALSEEIKKMRSAGVDHPVLEKISGRIVKRALTLSKI